jgi:hypothetical protein
MKKDRPNSSDDRSVKGLRQDGTVTTWKAKPGLRDQAAKRICAALTDAAAVEPAGRVDGDSGQFEIEVPLGSYDAGIGQFDLQ